MTITTQGQWTAEYEQLIIDTYCKGASKMEAQLFLSYCKRTGLEPGKQIYAVKRWDSGLKREVMTVQTAIDGYRLIAERTGCYSPGREPSFEYDKDNNLLSATAYIKKLTKDGSWHDIAATAHYEEYVQKTKDGSPTSFWKKMPRGQLAKCAEALAIRKAFPAELSGIYSQEEMAQSYNEEAKPVERLREDKETVKEVSGEECATFLNSFGGEKELVCQFIEELSKDKEWDMKTTMYNCINFPKKFKLLFDEWKTNRPSDYEKAQGE